VAAAREKPRWGYRRLQIVLEQSGAHVNHKRVYRVYREAGLMIHAGVFGIGSGHQFREPASDAGVGADCGGARSASGDSLRQRARVDVATFSGVVHGARDRACVEPGLTLAGLWHGASEGSKEKAPPSKTESGAPKILHAAAQAASPALSLNRAAISLQSGPLDGATLEVHSDAVAVVRQPLAMNHLPAGRITVQRSNPYRIAQLPEVFREYTSAVWTDVIGVRPLLFSIGTCRLTVREAHHDDDRQPPFRSATEPAVQRNLAHLPVG